MYDFYGLLGKASDQELRDWLVEDERNMLFMELFLAELQARQGGKRVTYDTHMFEANLYENLLRLRDALWEYEYHPSRGTAHIIFKPVQREIFAAPYVDRVVHHYIVNAIMDWWDDRLCYESGSCRVNKGTSFCIDRLHHHIASVTEHYTRPAYVVKMDISGYFMHIRRDILWERVLWGLERQFAGKLNTRRYKILKHACHEVIFDDPVKGARIQGSYADWRGLPEDKSLFCQPEGQGMVIGNLTSQYFSNIYLDVLDRFVTQQLGYKHYGRYVDDFYVVVTEDQLDKAVADVKVISTYLEGIGLSLNFKKTRVLPTWQGVPFLGMVVRNHAIMPAKRVTRNFSHAVTEFVGGTGSVESIVSYMGLLCHYNGEKITSKIFKQVGWEYKN